MIKTPYKLSTVLLGHTSDVRAVAAFTDGTIVSASRDKTARVWKRASNGTEYVESAVLIGHSSYISSICVINPSELHPNGFIITGSNDNTICIFAADQVEPTYTIKAHNDTVCNLSTGNEEGSFLSSSWDQSTKLWSVSDLSNPQLTLRGHTAAVWCSIILLSNDIVTGSADKLVIVWTRKGSIKHKLEGHTDCVRGIVAIKDNEFLTCANDATVRHWNASLGTCLGTYYGHENYIYSICSMFNGTYVFTSGEDQTIRVWHNGELDQTITLPIQTIWCINVFPNGDIISGGCDGIIRIFSANSERYAHPEVLERFEKEVADAKLNAQLQLGGIKLKDLPDTKVLQEPGQKDGQIKMINDGNTVKAYSWSQSEGKWICIGDVMGASGGSGAMSGRQLHNGIEYDHVFSVDIQDGVPPLKLPYNNDQDPWHVAQKFIDDNGLSQLYLDQVANFIVKNSQSAPVSNTSAGYADPFTGGNRYIPESEISKKTTDNTAKPRVHGLSDTSAIPSYIPHTKYVRLEQANTSAILEKLQELNSKQQSIDKVSQEKLELVIQLAGNQVSRKINIDAIAALKVLLNWPNDVVFPALDVARLAVLHKEVNELLCTEELLQIIRRYIKYDALPSNQMLTFRLLANMFCHENGEKLCLDSRDEILKAVLDLHSLGNKNNQVAISTYVLNLTVALNKYNDTPGRTRALNVLFAVLPRLNEPEAIFRALVGLGSILATTSDIQDRNELIKTVWQSETCLNILRTMSESTIDSSSRSKLVNCSKQIIDLIKTHVM